MNKKHFAVVRQGAVAISDWRCKHPYTTLNLADADLRGVFLRNADLNEAILTDAKLIDADLRDTDLSGADLSGADLRNACINDAVLTGAKLIGTKLAGAKLAGVDLRYANIIDADFTGADLTGVLFNFTEMEGACFIDADLDCASWPLERGSVGVQIDDRLSRQLIYYSICNSVEHLVAAGVSKAAIAEIVKYANGYHDSTTCGEIKVIGKSVKSRRDTITAPAKEA